MRSVEGDLAAVGVPELFREAAADRSTGCLTVTRENAEARVFFKNGYAYQARILGSGVRLGTRLISAGIIDNAQLERALAKQRAEGGRRKLGEILQEDGAVTAAQVKRIVEQQIEDTIFEVMRWDSGPFRFDQGVRSDEDVGLAIAVEDLIVEGARRFREWHQISTRVPTLEAIPERTDASAADGSLSPEESSLLSKVDGEATIAELAHMCGFTDLEAARTVDALVARDLLTLRFPEGFAMPATDPELEAAFEELERVLTEAAEARAAQEEQAAREEAERARLEAELAREEADRAEADAATAAAQETANAAARVVAEEVVETTSAQDFADLTDAGSRRPGQPAADEDEEDEEDEERDQETGDEAAEEHEELEVDPFVDTTALLREFSGFGAAEPEPPPRRRPASAGEDDKSKGRFGKKKR